MKVYKLILLRHGQTGYNASSCMQGQLDIKLSNLGYKQAILSAKLITKCYPNRIISSNLKRALETGKLIGVYTKILVNIDKRLNETNLGKWQGIDSQNIDAVNASSRLIWQSNSIWKPPKGESQIDVAKRSINVVDELVNTSLKWCILQNSLNQNQFTIVVITHGGIITALVAKLINLSAKHWFMLCGVENAKWVQLSGYYKASTTNSKKIIWKLNQWNVSI